MNIYDWNELRQLIRSYQQNNFNPKANPVSKMLKDVDIASRYAPMLVPFLEMLFLIDQKPQAITERHLKIISTAIDHARELSDQLMKLLKAAKGGSVEALELLTSLEQSGIITFNEGERKGIFRRKSEDFFNLNELLYILSEETPQTIAALTGSTQPYDTTGFSKNVSRDSVYERLAKPPTSPPGDTSDTWDDQPYMPLKNIFPGAEKTPQWQQEVRNRKKEREEQYLNEYNVIRQAQQHVLQLQQELPEKLICPEVLARCCFAEQLSQKMELERAQIYEQRVLRTNALEPEIRDAIPQRTPQELEMHVRKQIEKGKERNGPEMGR